MSFVLPRAAAADMSIAAESAEPAVVIADPAAWFAAEKVAIPAGWAAKWSLIVLIPFQSGVGALWARDQQTIAVGAVRS